MKKSILLAALVPGLLFALSMDKSVSAAEKFFKPKAGDMILCSNYQAIFSPCQVTAVKGDKYSVDWVWGSEKESIELIPGFMFPYDLKAGDDIKCMPYDGKLVNGKPVPKKPVTDTDGTDMSIFANIKKGMSQRNYKIVKAEGLKLTLKGGSKFKDEDIQGMKAMGMTDQQIAEAGGGGKEEVLPAFYCNVKRKVSPTVYFRMSPMFREIEKLHSIKKLPAAGMHDKGLEASVRGILTVGMETWDGASYIKVKKCVITSSGWEQVQAGTDNHAGRYVKDACGLDLQGGKCAVVYRGCFQPYLGKDSSGRDKYGPCEDKALYKQGPDQIACSAI